MGLEAVFKLMTVAMKHAAFFAIAACLCLGECSPGPMAASALLSSPGLAAAGRRRSSGYSHEGSSSCAVELDVRCATSSAMGPTEATVLQGARFLDAVS